MGDLGSQAASARRAAAGTPPGPPSHDAATANVPQRWNDRPARACADLIRCL